MGKFLKTSELHQAFQGRFSLDELKELKHFLSAKSRKGENDSIDVQAKDRVDMDDLI